MFTFNFTVGKRRNQHRNQSHWFEEVKSVGSFSQIASSFDFSSKDEDES